MNANNTSQGKGGFFKPSGDENKCLHCGQPKNTVRKYCLSCGQNYANPRSTGTKFTAPPTVSQSPINKRALQALYMRSLIARQKASDTDKESRQYWTEQ